MGGALEEIRQGYIQREIARSAYNYHRAVDSGEQVIVGINKFATEQKLTPRLLDVDETVEKRQVERLSRLKQERDKKKVHETLDRVRQVARTDENIMPVLVEAVRVYAIVGEISDALRDVFGEYRKPSVV